MASRPRDASTAAAPKTSGIAAATGERKTSRRTSNRIGTAISSAMRVERTDSSWIARESVAKLVCVAVTGEWIAASSVRFSPGTLSFTASSAFTWKSTRISALRGDGRRRSSSPRSHGESVVTLGSLLSARTSCGP